MSEQNVETGIVQTEKTAKVAKTTKVAKTAKVAKKPRRDKRDSIDVLDFLRVYTPMAREGKSAKEIGTALGRDEIYVCVKASQLRKKLAEQCKAENVSEENTARILAKVPKLSKNGASVLSIMTDFDV